MDTMTHGEVWNMLTPGGLFAAGLITLVGLGLLWLSLGGMSRRKVAERARRPLVAAGSTCALSVLLFLLAVAFVQVPLQTAVRSWMVANMTTADQAVLLFPLAIVSGLIQEPVKLLAALVGRTLTWGAESRGKVERTTREPAADAVLYGAPAGAGAGGFEAAILLSQILAAAPVAGAAATLPGIVERFFTLLAHVALTGLVVYAWWAGRGWLGLAAAAAVHGLWNYTFVVIATSLEATGIWVVEGANASLAVVLAVTFVRLIRTRVQRAGISWPNPDGGTVR